MRCLVAGCRRYEYSPTIPVCRKHFDMLSKLEKGKLLKVYLERPLSPQHLELIRTSLAHLEGIGENERSR